MSSEYSDLSVAVDHLDHLPDSILLLIFSKIADVKSLGRCCVVSRRFHSLVPQVDTVLVRVDCVISDDDSPLSSSTSSAIAGKIRSSSSSGGGGGGLSSFFRFFVGGLSKPFQILGQLLGPKREGSRNGGFDDGDCEIDQGSVTHHSPTQVLKNFNEIRFLRIELPGGELGIDDGVLLKWRADFGSTLDNCVILGASSVVHNNECRKDCTFSNLNENVIGLACVNGGNDIVGDDDGSIPESFDMNGCLKMRVVWTISSLIAASARHYLLQPIIAEHKTLENLVLTDVDGQGVLCMNRYQLEELRVKPLSASSASKRTLVPALSMRLWYAPLLELPEGIVLKGATLVAIRPSEQLASKKDVSDISWVSSAFEEPYATAVKMLVKRRTYCLEMNSF